MKGTAYYNKRGRREVTSQSAPSNNQVLRLVRKSVCLGVFSPPPHKRDPALKGKGRLHLSGFPILLKSLQSPGSEGPCREGPAVMSGTEAALSRRNTPRDDGTTPTPFDAVLENAAVGRSRMVSLSTRGACAPDPEQPPLAPTCSVLSFWPIRGRAAHGPERTGGLLPAAGGGGEARFSGSRRRFRGREGASPRAIVSSGPMRLGVGELSGPPAKRRPRVVLGRGKETPAWSSTSHSLTAATPEAGRPASIVRSSLGQEPEAPKSFAPA